MVHFFLYKHSYLGLVTSKEPKADGVVNHHVSVSNGRAAYYLSHKNKLKT